MQLRDIKDLLDAEVLACEEHLGRDINAAFVADLMSDVLAFATPGSLLITGLTNSQVLRTAEVLDIAAIILGRGKKLPKDAVLLAEELNIPVLTTRYILFEVAGRLYQNGVRGCIEQVKSK